MASLCNIRTPFPASKVLRTLTKRSSSLAAVANPIPASFFRGGTSKGIFLNRAHLPTDQSQWEAIFLGIMGSPDAQYGRQLNGMGGGSSSLSKICVVGSPSEPQKGAGIDVEYTFAQVGIRDSVIDYSGNCGNLSSMIGVFAVDEGICTPRISHGSSPRLTGTVRTFNTNTNKRIDNTFIVTESENRYIPMLDGERASIAGVPGRASPILLDFISPSGARTGQLLPTGRPLDNVQIYLPDSRETTLLPVSLIDATNPTVFTNEQGLRSALGIPDDDAAAINYAERDVVDALEYVRQAGARLMGLDPFAQAQPKVAVLKPPPPNDDADANIVINAFSMGVLHRAVPMTVALCLGVAACVPRTLAWDAIGGRRDSDAGKLLLRIRHPSGVVEVGAELDGGGEVTSARVMSTGRRLMKGVVWW
jgi:2-methylaconitate cis-trans-isomerase PrpF